MVGYVPSPGASSRGTWNARFSWGFGNSAVPVTDVFMTRLVTSEHGSGPARAGAGHAWDVGLGPVGAGCGVNYGCLWSSGGTAWLPTLEREE